MRLAFGQWLTIHFGARQTDRGHPLLGFAKALTAGWTIAAGTSAAIVPHIAPNDQMLPPLAQCVEGSAVTGLDSIRTKADIERKAADGPPPFRIALNDTFATDTERSGIANWIRLRSHCGRQAEMPPPADNAIDATSMQQMVALSRTLQSSVGKLIRALYYQELTYGEFAQKRYQFTREATELTAAIGEATVAADVSGLGRTLRNFLYLRSSWNAYLRRVNARQPRAVHIRGAIFT